MQQNIFKDNSNLHDGETTYYEGTTQHFYHHFNYYMNASGYCFNSTTYDYCSATNFSYIGVRYAIGVHSFLKYLFYQDPDPARHLFPAFMPHLLEKVRARFFG